MTPKKRKSPVRHKVHSHVRKGRFVKEYLRGRGSPNPTTRPPGAVRPLIRRYKKITGPIIYESQLKTGKPEYIHKRTIEKTPRTRIEFKHVEYYQNGKWHWLKADGKIYADGIFVGELKLEPAKHSKVLEIYLIEIREKYRRKGYASEIVKSAEKIAKQNFGATYIKIDARKDALPFWAKLGFKVVGKPHLEQVGVPAKIVWFSPMVKRVRK